MSWQQHFDKRQSQEIDFSRLYATDFQHGTDGHNAKLIIALMASILDEVQSILLDTDMMPRTRLKAIENIFHVWVEESEEKKEDAS